MANTIKTSGTKLFIGTTAANAATDTYTEIPNVTALGDFGDSFGLVTAQVLSDSRIRKQKGSGNAGQFTPNVLYDPANAGHQALITAGAATGSAPYNFKVELADEPASGAAPAPTTAIFKGFVMGTPISVPGPDDFVRLAATIEIDTIVSITPATTGD